MVRNKKLLPTFLRAVLNCEMFLLVYRYCCYCCRYCCCLNTTSDRSVRFKHALALFYMHIVSRKFQILLLCVYLFLFFLLSATENSSVLWQVVQWCCGGC